MKKYTIILTTHAYEFAGEIRKQTSGGQVVDRLGWRSQVLSHKFSWYGGIQDYEKDSM